MNKLVLFTLAIVLTGGIIALLWYFVPAVRKWFTYLSGYSGNSKTMGTITSYSHMEPISLDTIIGADEHLGISNYQPTGMRPSSDALKALQDGNIQEIADNVSVACEYGNISWNLLGNGEIRDLNVRFVFKGGISGRDVATIVNQTFAGSIIRELGMSDNWKCYRLY